MAFKDNLTFLMGLTETKNRQLANAIMVDPSLISRLRNGKRNIPNNAEYINSIAKYIASRCLTTLQRDALARAIGKHIDFSDEEQTANVINTWLMSDAISAQSAGDLILQSFDSVESLEEFAEEIVPLKTDMNDHKQTVYAFYGNTGKQLATQLLFEMILSAKTPTELRIVTGNNTEWLWKDRKYSEQISNYINKAVSLGCTVTHIIPQNQNITMTFDSINRWLPLYPTGQVQSYYYPYLRDKIFNRTLYIARGIAAIESTTIGNKTDSGLTVLMTEPDLIASVESEFDDYLDLCIPASAYYNSKKQSEDIYKCISNFAKCQSDCINIVGGLSYITTPKEVLLEFAQNTDNLSAVTLVQNFDSAYKDFERLLQKHRYTEILFIDSFENLVSKEVHSCGINGKTFFYTPDAYAKHLKNVITMLEKNKNYQVVLAKGKTLENSICVKNGYSILSFTNKAPYSVCEIKNPSFVNAVWEYALNIVEMDKPDQLYKKQVITVINQFIEQINYVS